MAKIKILIADDHQLFLDGIISLLSVEKDFDIAASAKDGNKALELLSKNKFDICILDINMPLLNGIETAKAIKEKKIETHIIILTTHNDPAFISELMLTGVSGYVLKSATKAELARAIRDVMKDEKYFSSEVQDSILKSYVSNLKKEKNISDEDTAALTQREIEIVQLLAREYTNENIASALFISYRTVETHRKNIMQKTKTKNLAGLMKYAYSKGIIK